MKHPARTSGLAALAVVVLVAINQRGPMVAPAGVITELAGDLRLDAGRAGLAVGLPVFCFSVVAPFVPAVTRRIGVDRAVLLALLALGLGGALRVTGGVTVLVAGTLLLGVAVTTVNVAMPSLMHERFDAAHRPGATSAQLAAMNVGAMLTVSATAPLAAWLGWRGALAAWSLLAFVAAAALLLVPTPRLKTSASGAPASPSQRSSVAGVGGSWTARGALAVAFGAQAFAAIGATAWLPTLLHEQAGIATRTAGLGASLFQLLGIAGALTAAPAARRFSPTACFLALGALWAFLPLGLWLAPGAWPVWVAVTGFGQGACIAYLFVLVVTWADGPADALRLSSLVQTVGYAIAAFGPSVLGALGEGPGGWPAALAGIGVAVVVLLAGGLTAARTAKGPRSPERSRALS